MAKVEALLEAEKRGLLSPEMQGALDEARKRGLVKPADIEPSPKTPLPDAPKEIPLDDPTRPSLVPDTRPFLETTTGGMVSRGAFEAAGATVGGLIGGGVSAPTGPGASLGLLGGSMLGAAGGSATFDFADAVARAVTGQAPRPEPFLAPTEKAVEAAIIDGAFTTGALTLGPVLRMFKSGTKKVLNIGDESARLSRIAEDTGVPIGILQASESRTVKGISRVLGVFPFVGSPIKKGAKATEEALRKQWDDILNTLAPNGTLADLGVDLTNAAKGRYVKFQRVAAALYDRFYNIADNLSTKEVFPTEKVKEAVAGLIEQAQISRIQLSTGKGLISPVGDPVGAFVNQLNNLPDKITIRQARGLQRMLNESMSELARNGKDIGDLKEIKKALELDMNNPDLALLSKEEGVKVVGALRMANSFYAENIKKFETVTAKRFGRADKNIFHGGAFEAGTINQDEAFDAVFNSRSIEAIGDLFKLVGPKEFRRASRQYLADSFDRALVSDGKRGVRFDAEKFSQRIGLDTKQGRASLEKMLAGSGVSINDLSNFTALAKATDSLHVPDTSVFLQRRFVLGGVRNILGGFAMGAVGLQNPTGTVIAVLLARHGAKVLSSPQVLKDLTAAMKPNISESQKHALVIRAARTVLGDE